MATKPKTNRGLSSASSFVRKYELKAPYRFEWCDFATLGYAINIILIVVIGLSAAWFGLVLGLVNLIHEIRVGRRLNGLVMQGLTIALNVYFLFLYYGAV